MRPAYAGVDDIGVNAGAVSRRREPAVERERALIDAIEAPRDWRPGLQAAQRTAREDRQDEQDGQEGLEGQEGRPADARPSCPYPYVRHTRVR